MKVWVSPGRALALDAVRTTSARGGVYDLDALGLGEEAQAAFLRFERAHEVTDGAAALIAEHVPFALPMEGSGQDGRIVKADVEEALAEAEDGGDA